MAIETAEEAEAPKPDESKADKGPPKEVGPLGRATELFMFSGFALVAHFLMTGDLDLQKQFLYVSLALVLSLLGGVLTNVKYKPPPENKPAT